MSSSRRSHSASSSGATSPRRRIRSAASQAAWIGAEQLGGGGLDHVRGERRIVLGGLCGGELDAPLALADPAALGPTACSGGPG